MSSIAAHIMVVDDVVTHEPAALIWIYFVRNDPVRIQLGIEDIIIVI